jgi:hypothetical protein
MTIQTDITLADWAAFVRCVSRRAWKHSMLFYWALVLGMGVAAGVTVRMTGLELHAPSFFAGLVVGIIFLMSLSRLLARGMQPAADGYILGPKQVEVTETGLRVVSKHHEAFFDWAGVRGAEMADKHIFVMVDQNAGIIMPHSSFASDSEREQFVKEVRGRMGGSPA